MEPSLSEVEPGLPGYSFAERELDQTHTCLCEGYASRGRDASFDESNDTICFTCDQRIVSHHDYSEVLFGIQGAQNTQDVFPRLPIQISGWFISQQNLRLGD